MRQIVLDTETTGREYKEGHKVIEIGCIEIINRRITGNNYHQYINPLRESEAGALAIHGLTQQFLQQYPVFAQITTAFLDFIKGAELIIHNAAFDIGFLNNELLSTGKNFGKITDYCTIFDTLTLARQLHPGQRNSLDALCKRYEVDNTHRNLHGAMLDADLLARVYLAMTGGQTTLFENQVITNEQTALSAQTVATKTNHYPVDLMVIPANSEELAAHASYLNMLNKKAGKTCLWQTEDS